MRVQDRPGESRISKSSTRHVSEPTIWLGKKAIKSNLGIEGKLFNNKLDFVVDIFHDQRNGIFQQRVQVPEYVGVVSNPYANVGKMKSYGADGNISFTQDITPDSHATRKFHVFKKKKYKTGSRLIWSIHI